jgi:hypothetical protein
MSAQAARRTAEVENPAEHQSFRSIEDLQQAGINVSQIDHLPVQNVKS